MLIALALLVCTAVLAPAAPAAVATAPAQGDSWTTSRYPNRNYGAERVLRVHANPVKRAYLRFDVGTLAGPVQRAVLRIYAESAAPNGFRVSRAATGWTEQAITHGNAPAVGALVATVGAFTARNAWREIDVTSAVAGSGLHAFVLTAPGATADVVLTSKEGGRPAELVVTTSDGGPDPDPDPDPGPGGACSRADATGCAPGSRVALLNSRFSCARPLAEIAAQNGIGGQPGRLPLLVRVDFTTYRTLDPAVVEIRRGCRGDGNANTIDLILQVEGDGRTIGGGADAIKVRENPSNIQLTGYANCGPRGLGQDGRRGTADDAHQDGAQIQGGTRIEFIDFEWGDWETSTATCQGAAGTFVPGSVNGFVVTDMACIRCKSVSCNHGMLLSGSSRTTVVDSRWRTGNPADRTVRLANGQIGLCDHGSPACVIDERRALNYTILRNTCDRFPYEDGQ